MPFRLARRELRPPLASIAKNRVESCGFFCGICRVPLQKVKWQGSWRRGCRHLNSIEIIHTLELSPPRYWSRRTQSRQGGHGLELFFCRWGWVGQMRTYTHWHCPRRDPPDGGGMISFPRGVVLSSAPSDGGGSASACLCLVCMGFSARDNTRTCIQCYTFLHTHIQICL